MTPTTVFWCIVGLLVGGAHVWMLWRAAQPPFDVAVWHWMRLLLIGGIFVLSAFQGGLLPAVSGWGVMSCLTIAFVVLRRSAA